MATLDQATVSIAFPSDHQYSNFRDWLHSEYKPEAARTTREAVYVDGRGTVASVVCFPGLRAEIRGKAFSNFHGRTIE